MAILEALCERRHEQVANLAFEFGVTSWTIRQDIQTLSTLVGAIVYEDMEVA